MPSSPCSAHRSPTRTTPSEPCGRAFGCRRRSAAYAAEIDADRPADAHRRQHRRGARRHPRRVRLHGDGRRREHGVAAAGPGAAGRRARRLGDDRPVPAVDPSRAVRHHPSTRSPAGRAVVARHRRRRRRDPPGALRRRRSSGAVTSARCSTLPSQLVRNGHSGVVSIIGEAGAGKSRLADEVIGAAGGRGDRRAHRVRALRRRQCVGAHRQWHRHAVRHRHRRRARRGGGHGPGAGPGAVGPGPRRPGAAALPRRRRLPARARLAARPPRRGRRPRRRARPPSPRWSAAMPRRA